MARVRKWALEFFRLRNGRKQYRYETIEAGTLDEAFEKAYMIGGTEWALGGVKESGKTEAVMDME